MKVANSRRTVTPELIVETAVHVVEAVGIDALSMTRVANELGVTQPALYNHVEGVEDLLRRVALSARQRLLEEVRDAAVGRWRDDAVAAVATAWRQFVCRHPGLYAATDRHPLVGYPELEAAVADIVSVLHRVAVGYGMSEADAAHGAWSLRSALHGFVVLEVERGHPGPLDLDESFARLVALLCAGLRGMAAQGGLHGALARCAEEGDDPPPPAPPPGQTVPTT